MPQEKLSPELAKSRNEKIREYLKNNPSKLKADYSGTAKLFNTTSEIVRHQSRALRDIIGDSSPEFKIDDEILRRRENGEIKALKRQIEQFIKDYERLSDAYDVALNLKTQDVSSVDSAVIEEDTSNNEEAAVVIQLSDCHFGKKISPSSVNRMNNYNLDIARERMDTLAENFIKLVKKERHDIKIENLVLILGGDFLENSQLHEHSEMTTELSPMEETLFAREMLVKFIRTIQDYCDFKNVLVPCVYGNHARGTRKMDPSIDHRMSYESILYNILKQDFSDSTFKWIIPDSGILEFSVFNRKMRTFHGHQVKYGGGIGGLTIPLNKFIMRLDQSSPCQYNFLHHYHNYSFPTSKSTLNGSLVGIDPYAYSLGCEYQPPIQSFQLIDKRRGMTVRIPIMCEK